MEIVITIALILIAGAMLLGKPLQITVVHKLDQPTAAPTQPKETEEEKQQSQALDAALQVIHDFMGVKNDDDNN